MRRSRPDTQQEPPKIHMPQQHVAETTMGGSAKEGEAARGAETSNLEENWGSQEYNEEGGDITKGIQERGDTAGGLQGESPHIDTYSQGMRAELTEQKPAGWWSYEDYYRQVSVLQEGSKEQKSNWVSRRQC